MVDPNHPRDQHRTAMPLGVDRPLVVLRRGHGREPVDPAPDAVDRRAVLGDAVLRLAADDTLAPPSGRHGLSQAGAPPDATAGGARALPAAQDVSAAPGAPDLSLPAARSADHAAEPRVVHGCYLHSPAAGLSVPGRCDGLASRTGLSWRLSNTLDAHFCVEALHEALEHYGPPEIFNSDQGSQFTSVDFTDVLTEAGIRISMDGKGRWMDNVFIERLWRSLKYECVSLSEFATGAQARTGIGGWMDFYDRRRPHSALNDRTPAEAYTDDGADGSLGLCPGSRQPKVA